MLILIYYSVTFSKVNDELGFFFYKILQHSLLERFIVYIEIELLDRDKRGQVNEYRIVYKKQSGDRVQGNNKLNRIWSID
jgi:hypothetical protein